MARPPWLNLRFDTTVTSLMVVASCKVMSNLVRVPMGMMTVL